MPSIEKLETRWLREGAADDKEFENFLARRRGGEPVHRILGWREFWGLKFYLSPATLEPRPDSETMIEVLIKLYRDKTQRLRILDMGTGTGCLLLAALTEFPNATGMGTDAAPDAIATAQKNAAHLGLAARAEFQALSWHDTAAMQALGRFDVILSNPPYIPKAEITRLEPEVREHDPIAALDGGADGLEPYRRISAQLNHLLNAGGTALFEIGYDQAAAVTEILRARGYDASAPHQDLGGRDRIITATAR